MVDRQAVPLGVGEDGSVANARVPCLADELDPCLLQLRLRSSDIRDADDVEPYGNGTKGWPAEGGSTSASVTFPVSNSTQVAVEFGFR